MDGELPTAFENKIAGKPLLGLLLTAAAVLVIANLVPLDAISLLASAGFLIIFAAANLANVKLSDRTNSRRWLSVIGAIACVGALGAHIVTNQPQA